MKPNERFGAQIIFVICVLTCFVVGAVAYNIGVEHGYDGKIPAIYMEDYSDDTNFNEILDNNYLIDSKKTEGGNKYGNEYRNNSKDAGRTRETNRTHTESDKYRGPL